MLPDPLIAFLTSAGITAWVSFIGLVQGAQLAVVVIVLLVRWLRKRLPGWLSRIPVRLVGRDRLSELQSRPAPPPTDADEQRQEAFRRMWDVSRARHMWELTRNMSEKYGYRLSNLRTVDATDVHLEPLVSRSFEVRDFPNGVDVGPEGSVDFHGRIVDGMWHSAFGIELKVTWEDTHGDVRSETIGVPR